MSATTAQKIRRPYYPSFFSVLRYLARPESQTFAFSVATMAVLSFFPFMVVLIMLIRRGIESPAMYGVLLQILRDHIPIGQELVIKTLNSLVNAHKGAQIGSLILLLFAARGVFMPLEVALNRTWGFMKSRNWVHNQIVGSGLTLLCGLLALISIALTAGNQYLLTEVLGKKHAFLRLGTFIVMKFIATCASVTIFFLIYWLIPAGKVEPRQVFPAALLFGLIWELLKYGYILLLPHLSFQEVYGPFGVSVALLFWGYISGLVMLAGGFFSAGRR